uniref:Uncharacterized protein n=1 Tax=Oryza rufipogon TaxID=4529 RepID=A0A0E0QQR1_ORYRU
MATKLYRYCWVPSSSLLVGLPAADWFLRLHGYVTSSPLIGNDKLYAQGLINSSARIISSIWTCSGYI